MRAHLMESTQLKKGMNATMCAQQRVTIKQYLNLKRFINKTCRFVCNVHSVNYERYIPEFAIKKKNKETK